MPSCLVVLFLAGLAPATTLSIQGASKISFDVEAAKNRPVSKVINLLKDMQKTLEEEAKADEEVYDQLACWCETNDKEKSKAIADAEAKIKALNIAIEELTSASTRLQAEIEQLETEVSKQQAGLDKATAMRMKEQSEFNTEEKDMLQAVSALKAAIVVIGKHHSAALLQGGASDSKILQVTTLIKHELQKHGSLLDGVLTHRQRKLIGAFVQAPESFFLQQKQAPSAGSYAPQSGQILGILKQMLETFSSNLSQSQKEELKNSEDYENLKTTKEAEIAAATAQIETKTQELATTDEKLAIAKTDLEDTENSLTADQKFLMNLRQQCQTIDGEWEARQKTRTEEMGAISKALEFLSSDEAHDLFTKTFNFVQRQSTLKSKVRDQASKFLEQVGRKHKNPKLVTLALQIRLDAFTKVKAAIDDMIAELSKEQADEVKHKDFCVKELNLNQRATEDKEREKSSLEATVDDLTMTIDDLGSAIETLKAEIKEMQFQMKRAGEDREKENSEFQATVSDQRATQKLLKQALEVLKGFYDKKAAFMQKEGKQTPPTGFKAYKKNESSGGVMNMIQTIIDDAKLAENEAITAESDAQKAYESFVKDTNASIEEKTKDMTNKAEAKAKAEVEKTRSEESLEKVKLDLDGLSSEAADLHQSCDFTLKNFEIRQTGRMQEIEALKQVKAILSGAKFANFLQSDVFADDDSSVVSETQGSQDPDFDPLQAYLD
jgi:chromosome segregation ATPase